ncbi:hypothetical protein ASPWEDRAFT_181089 [Aspergillus wentii DTO 134E9]|uniref:Uncharacterized protein n=1 Tax=Aspergillus wentii DTO 134E9 TaxID=1073089 RepID=A0A1L9RXP9_ASPWE|nr:uncharacterized protein ASPWEDRAFT_181089 [Aspergillus wentii DTO 134E9]OJJ39720.1 hypothetical protein ASPWEDRAFT_181089 [Aspergillus wentii DTO 134E9]
MSLSIDSILQLISIFLTVPQTLHAIWELMARWVRRLTRREENLLPISRPQLPNAERTTNIHFSYMVFVAVVAAPIIPSRRRDG